MNAWFQWLVFPLFALLFVGAAFAELVLVENDQSHVPIVVFADAPPFIRQAAKELADYIEKISGARPPVLDGQPDPLPENAIWVGFQPVLETLFPAVDFAFAHPEEILIAATAHHLVIAGRDVWDPDNLTARIRRETVVGIQREYGTVNAVYTFLQDFLGVRWLWPGALGEDVPSQDRIAFEPFVWRYHPRWRSRSGLFTFSKFGGGGRMSEVWTRLQRLSLDSLPATGGHSFTDWWERYHGTDRDLFALQPNGSRGGDPAPWPGASTIKVCKSNPKVWKKWLLDVAEQRALNPAQVIFGGSPNDGWLSGFCVCAHCQAWDHPGGQLRSYNWQGLSAQGVALADRQVTFANILANVLETHYPGEGLQVLMHAYGNSRPAPVAAVPAANVRISNVANFLLRSEKTDRGSTIGALHRDQLADWGKVAIDQIWRPNTGSPVGWQQGLPDVPLTNTLIDFRHADASGCVGIFVDSVWEHWSTQGPLYYLMAHLTWNPDLNAEALMGDYYLRAFGPAAVHMEAYWGFMEDAREACRAAELAGVEGHSRSTYYSHALLDTAEALLDAAIAELPAAQIVYRDRIEFVRAGLTYTRIYNECGRLMALYLQDPVAHADIADQIRRNWDEIAYLSARHPEAMNWRRLEPRHGRTAAAHPDGTAAPVRLPLVGFLEAPPFALANLETGSRRFTNSNVVEIIGLTIPDDFDQVQFTRNGALTSIQPDQWQPAVPLPSTVAFALPASDQGVNLYAWATNTTADPPLPVRRSQGAITYTTVTPQPVLVSTLERLTTDETVTLHPWELDAGSTGGVFGGQTLDIIDQRVRVVSGTHPDLTPEAPFVTLPHGEYQIALRIVNEAGTATTSDPVPVTISSDFGWISATGGDWVFQTVISNVRYRIHVFTQTTNATFTVTTCGRPAGLIDTLIVAGGGGGGFRTGGGGGAGGVILREQVAIRNGDYSVVVGTGGNRRTTSGQGFDGQNSAFLDAIALGGGGGGNRGASGYRGRDGGSGGGRGQNTATTAPQAGAGLQPTQLGNSRGLGRDGFNTNVSIGSGGGGAGAPAGQTHSGRSGGSGINVAHLCTDRIGDGGWVGGGGAGNGSNRGTLTPGSLGGGGGTDHDSPGQDAMPNTGGGGGGGSDNNGDGSHQGGGAGGSGIVVIRYRLPPATILRVK